MIYPDFIRRCILFVENIQDYQVTQLADGSITIALSHRTESMEQAIFAQFELLAHKNNSFSQVFNLSITNGTQHVN